MTDDTLPPTSSAALAAAPGLDGVVVAVTGANGFVGARTCLLLARRGADVRALVRRAGAAPSAARVTEVVVDLGDDGRLAGSLTDVDVVVHTAAVAGPDIEAARTVNVEGTRSVLAAARRAGVGRVVHVSTTSVIAADRQDVDEDAPLVGDDAGPYAVTKRDAERVVAEAATDGDRLSTVVLRPPAVLGWGPTSTWGQRVPTWVRDGGLPMENHPDASFSWVHVDDLAAATARAAVTPEADGRVYLVVAGTTTWGTYLDELRSWFPGSEEPPTADDRPSPRRPTSARAREELGWEPTVAYDEAMAEIAAHHA